MRKLDQKRWSYLPRVLLVVGCHVCLLALKKFLILTEDMFINSLPSPPRERTGGGGDTSMGCLPYTPQKGTDLTTFWCTGQHSNQLNTQPGLLLAWFLNSLQAKWKGTAWSAVLPWPGQPPVCVRWHLDNRVRNKPPKHKLNFLSVCQMAI